MKTVFDLVICKLIMQFTKFIKITSVIRRGEEVVGYCVKKNRKQQIIASDDKISQTVT